MQKRHGDRSLYFNELVATSKEFYIDYITRNCNHYLPKRVLEIGCGEGGNLLPFAELGAYVEGVDLNEEKINFGNKVFADKTIIGQLRVVDFLKYPLPECDDDKFDLVLIHDVIEHIEPNFKREFVLRIKEFLQVDGIIFFAFPAWQMPFGGHQQICSNFIAKVPYIHLLPMGLYTLLLRISKQSNECIDELLSVRRSKMPIEKFEDLYKSCELKCMCRHLWFINPHYKQKFHLTPRLLNKMVGNIPFIRNFFTTSCWYLLTFPK